jgi:hypothetical protein
MRRRGQRTCGSIVAASAATGEEHLVDRSQLLAPQDEPLPWPAGPLLARGTLSPLDVRRSWRGGATRRIGVAERAAGDGDGHCGQCERARAHTASVRQLPLSFLRPTGLAAGLALERAALRLVDESTRPLNGGSPAPPARTVGRDGFGMSYGERQPNGSSRRTPSRLLHTVGSRREHLNGVEQRTTARDIHERESPCPRPARATP